ncbi:hypothetical protein L9F63_016588, partial [Diploptera punctata]
VYFNLFTNRFFSFLQVVGPGSVFQRTCDVNDLNCLKITSIHIPVCFSSFPVCFSSFPFLSCMFQFLSCMFQFLYVSVPFLSCMFQFLYVSVPFLYVSVPFLSFHFLSCVGFSSCSRTVSVPFPSVPFRSFPVCFSS